MFIDVGAVSRGVQDLGALAASGDLAINEDEATAALKALKSVKDDLADLLQQGNAFGSSLQLGANPVGRAMAEKSLGRATGPDSLIAVVRSLRDQAERAEHALNQCIRNYVGTDTGEARKYPGA